MALNTGGKTGKNETSVVDRTERITVALVTKASEDLQRLQDRSGHSKTDIVNRAITAYEFLDAQLRAGKDLLVKDPKTGETQLIKFL